MRLLKLILPVLIAFQICTAQTDSNVKTVQLEEFNWIIAIPDSLTALEQGQWGKMLKKDVTILGEDIRNQEVTLFSYQDPQSNMLTAVWQPYDAEICGDYLELNAEADKVMHQMYESQLAGGNFDSITKSQTVSNLEFKRFDVTIDFPDVIQMNVIRFYRLFGNKQFNMYITVTDEKSGQKMLDAFLQSKFE